MSNLLVWFAALGEEERNRAADFTYNKPDGGNRRGEIVLNGLHIAEKDFCLTVRAARVDNGSGYWIMANSTQTLDAIGFYQLGGNWLAYFQAPGQAGFFRAIADAQALPIGEFAEIAFRRTGSLFTASLNGVAQWTETRSNFPLDPLTALNIGYRGGGGGGTIAASLVDYITLDVVENGATVRYLDIDFNEEQEFAHAINHGALGGAVPMPDIPRIDL